MKRFAGDWLLFAHKSNTRNIKHKWNLCGQRNCHLKQTIMKN